MGCLPRPAVCSASAQSQVCLEMQDLNRLTAWLSLNAGAGFTGLAYTLPPAFTLGPLLLLRWERWQAVRASAVMLGLAGALWLVIARMRTRQLTGGAALLLLVVPIAIGAGNVYRFRYLPRHSPPLWIGAAAAVGASAWLLPAWMVAPAALNALGQEGFTYLAGQVLAATVGLTMFFTGRCLASQ